MLNRIAVILVVVLGLAAPTHAQTPESIPTEPAPVFATEGPTPTEKGQATTMELVNSMPADNAPMVVSEFSSVGHGPENCWWVAADYLFGWIRGSPVPPLVTTSPAGTPQAAAGVLGPSTTSVLFGGTGQGSDLRSGLRLGAGAWLNDDYTFGVDFGFFMLDSQSAGFSANSPQGTPILARPFFNVLTQLQDSQVFALPGFATGSVSASVHSNSFYSANVDFQEVVLAEGGFRLGTLLGYRFFRFDERLTVDTNEVLQGGGLVVAGTQFVTEDRFAASNTFHGVDFGLRTEYCGEAWSVALLTKVAVGNLTRGVGISGHQTVSVPGSAAPAQYGAGFLALSSNSGTFDTNDWVLVPEAAVDLGWDVTDHVRLSIGYSFLYANNLARASNQVNLNLNPNLLPPAVAGATPNSPEFHLVKTDIWVQTINLGVELRY